MSTHHTVRLHDNQFSVQVKLYCYCINYIFHHVVVRLVLTTEINFFLTYYAPNIRIWKKNQSHEKVNKILKKELGSEKYLTYLTPFISENVCNTDQ